MTTTWRCDVCGEDNRPEDRQCYNCTRIRGMAICAWCGYKIGPGKKQCGACGQKRGTKPPERTG